MEAAPFTWLFFIQIMVANRNSDITFSVFLNRKEDTKERKGNANIHLEKQKDKKRPA